METFGPGGEGKGEGEGGNDFLRALALYLGPCELKIAKNMSLQILVSKIGCVGNVCFLESSPSLGIIPFF